MHFSRGESAWKKWKRLFQRNKSFFDNENEEKENKDLKNIQKAEKNKTVKYKQYRSSNKINRILPLYEQTYVLTPLIKKKPQSYMNEAAAAVPNTTYIPQEKDHDYSQDSHDEDPTYDSLDAFHEKIMYQREHAAQDFAQYQQEQYREFQKRQDEMWTKAQQEAQEIFQQNQNQQAASNVPKNTSIEVEMKPLGARPKVKDVKETIL